MTGILLLKTNAGIEEVIENDILQNFLQSKTGNRLYKRTKTHPEKECAFEQRIQNK